MPSRRNPSPPSALQGMRVRTNLDAAARVAPSRTGRSRPRVAAASEPEIDPKSPWYIDPGQFPRTGGTAAQLRFCLKAAVLAPSSHNTQPWRFRVEQRTVEVFADRTRALPVADPNDRELTISCGAALEHLRVAMRRFGLEPRVDVMPDADQPDLLARVSIAGRHEATRDDHRLFDAITQRRTVRVAFDGRSVPDAVLTQMATHAAEHAVAMRLIVGSRPRAVLAELIAEADEIQLANPAFRRELAMWMHHNRSHQPDGIPGFALGLGELASLVAPLVVRTFDVGHGRAAHDEQLAMHSPVLCLLGTDTDRPADWVRSGRALALVLLIATGEGVGASYLNQPIEVPELRPRLHRLVSDVPYAQLVLRMGYAPSGKRTPRRRVEDVLIRPG